MSVSHHIGGSEQARSVFGALAHWPWKLILLLGGSALLAPFAISHPFVALWVLFVVLCWLFIAGAAESSEDMRRTGPRGRS